MPLDEELAAWLRLSLLPELSARAFRELLQAFGSPEAVVAAGRAALERHVPPRIATRIGTPPPEAALAALEDWLEQPGNRLITLGDAAYPPQLIEIADPPPLLYVKGRAELLARPAIAIVGSRHATPQGLANAEAFARALGEAGLTIVSGLALGIDASAHRGGLATAASSVAVLGTGADIVYPAAHRGLAHELFERGTLVTELPLGSRPLPAHFPRRNRLISGLALGCLVVEAAIESGSLITARLAIEQGREVFAIPGSIHSPQSKGCHALIRQGAKLVDTAQDILDDLRVPQGPRQTVRTDPSPETPPSVRRLLEALGEDPCDVDTLAARSGLAAADLAALLTRLELDGVVVSLPGGRVQRIHR